MKKLKQITLVLTILCSINLYSMEEALTQQFQIFMQKPIRFRASLPQILLTIYRINHEIPPEVDDETKTRITNERLHALGYQNPIIHAATYYQDIYDQKFGAALILKTEQRFANALKIIMPLAVHFLDPRAIFFIAIISCEIHDYAHGLESAQWAKRCGYPNMQQVNQMMAMCQIKLQEQSASQDTHE